MIMKKIIIIFVVIICLIIIVVKNNHITINVDVIDLQNIQIRKNEVCFNFRLAESGCGLSSYQWELSDEVLKLRFYGTIFEPFKMMIPDGYIKLPLDNQEVKTIVIVDDLNEKIVWKGK